MANTPAKPRRASYTSDAAYKKALAKWTQRYGAKKKGALNWNKTKRWDGDKWVPVNIVHKGQRAKLGGKNVYADGKGNWRSLDGVSNDGRKDGQVVGTYTPGKNRVSGVKTKVGKAPKTNKPQRPVANIPPSEGSFGPAEQKLRYGRYQDGAITIKDGVRWKWDGKNNRWISLGWDKPTKTKSKPDPKPKPKTKPIPRSDSRPTPTRKPIPKPAEKKSAIHTYKAHGSATHVGRYKTLKEHRAAVEARKKKQK